MIRRARPIALTLAFVFVLPAVTALAQEPAEEPPPPPPPPPPLATAGSDAITTDNWLSLMKAFYGAQALRDIIEERLIIQETHRLGLTITQADIDARIARMRVEYPTEAAFHGSLRDRGIHLNALRREVKREILLDRIVDKQAKISDEDVGKYYEAHLSEYSTPARIELYAITTADMRTSAQAYERLAHQEFAAVAEELSIDEHAAEGGFWGRLTAEELEPEVLEIKAFNLEAGGAHSEPIQADDKVYILWVKSKEPEFKVTLTEAAPKIRERLRAQRGITRESVMRGIIGRAKIAVNRPEYAFLVEEYAKAKQIRVVVDDTPLDLYPPPVMLKTHRVVVPADPVAKAIGADAQWWEKTKTLQVKRGDIELLTMIGSPIGVIKRVGEEDQQVTIYQPPVMRGGVLYFSPRWIVEQLGGSILWLPGQYELRITSVKESVPVEEAPSETPETTEP